LEVRNKFALTTDNIRHIYTDLNFEKPKDFFILSTCNRTEIYGITDKPETLVSFLSHYSHAGEEEVKNYTFSKENDEAMQHLFQVASGLDSQILGDYEIIGQLKNAFALSKANDCLSGYMEKLVNASLQASRQVRNATSISDGTTSVSYAVIQLLKQQIGDQNPMNICLMGLGKIGTLTLKNLKSYLPQHKITLINRNETKAQITADEYGVAFAKFDEQDEILQNSDVLIVATGADHPIVTREQIESSKVRILFDLSVPSNVSPEVKTLSGLSFFDIDSLSKIVNETISKRRDQVPLALEIIDEHIEGFKEWEKRRALYTKAETDK
jgi:glutamyl-tRNA reductase